MIKSAILSDDRKHRYLLSRIWNQNNENILFIMLNPSSADEDLDDRTTKKIIRFSKKWGFGGLYICNLYTYRTSSPKKLFSLAKNKRGSNKDEIKKHAKKCSKVVYAWGNKEKVPSWLNEMVLNPTYIELSKEGVPKHPLYLKSNLRPRYF
ncbi:MAG: DUF1643 domain-containing protein [Bacteroidota bacterium]|nr:DUF1643 domain-containing protein [Bacteroidota bacterium]